MARLAASAPSLFGSPVALILQPWHWPQSPQKPSSGESTVVTMTVSICFNGHPDDDWMTGATRKSEKIPEKMAWVKIFETSRLWSFCKNVSEFQASFSRNYHCKCRNTAPDQQQVQWENMENAIINHH